MDASRFARLLFVAGAPALTLLLAGGCSTGAPPPVAIAPAAGEACALDGMLLADYPGPKAQIHYASGPPEFFCDTVEMFSLLLRPEEQRPVRAAYTQDMGQADWRTPRGHWIDARSAWYVRGSRRQGSMGPTFAAFARAEDAAAFAREHGGQVLRFAEVTADMADLRGGADHGH
ncbi:MAG: nitrous oxide reductase accessory protein NosL [Gammaproteobacteria bacterium]|nr:nitrous oxide reductase accessory protein NosL [Gammaproteobacteria bacterium]